MSRTAPIIAGSMPGSISGSIAGAQPGRVLHLYEFRFAWWGSNTGADVYLP